MKIAVLSGKGGAGKTFVSVNLAAAAKRAVYIDCDVEEPDGRLFFKPENEGTEQVYVSVPEFDPELCDGCRRCVDFCRFNALVYVKGKTMVFPEVCHSCGGCALVCPKGAVTERERPVGIVEQGQHGGVTVVTGVLSTGEASAVPVIRAALRCRGGEGELTVIDCPPGSGCAVMTCVEASDCCVLVTEPTSFGLHNFKMIHELVRLLRKPCCVVVNKECEPYIPLLDYCEAEGIPVPLKIPYSPELAEICGGGRIAAEASGQYGELFRGLLDSVAGGVCR